MATYDELAGALEALTRSVRARTISKHSVLLARCEALVKQARAGDNREIPWSAFQQAAGPDQPDPRAIVTIAKATGKTHEEIRQMIMQELVDQTIMVNSRYQVMVRPSGSDMTYLSIKRLDQRPIRSWRDLQRIKNELVGPECEGLEMFPAESRLLDSANQYHLFVFSDPQVRLPFGQQEHRLVMDDQGATGAGQEPFDE